MKVPIALIALFLGGCISSTTGPFVTDLRGDDQGRLVVEKCHLNYSDILKQLQKKHCGWFLLDLKQASPTTTPDPVAPAQEEPKPEAPPETTPEPPPPETSTPETTPPS